MNVVACWGKGPSRSGRAARPPYAGEGGEERPPLAPGRASRPVPAVQEPVGTEREASLVRVQVLHGYAQRPCDPHHEPELRPLEANALPLGKNAV